jgi:hypothetical protein
MIYGVEWEKADPERAWHGTRGRDGGMRGEHRYWSTKRNGIGNGSFHNA